MARQTSGVARRIADDDPRAVYVHCLAHCLNVELQESARNIPIYRDMMEYLKDIINMIRVSSKRSLLLANHQQDSLEWVACKRKSLRPLCPTRWTTRQDSILQSLNCYIIIVPCRKHWMKSQQLTIQMLE